jgi:hypothetical protein
VYDKENPKSKIKIKTNLLEITALRLKAFSFSAAQFRFPMHGMPRRGLRDGVGKLLE